MKFKILKESVNIPHNAKVIGDLTDEELIQLSKDLVEEGIIRNNGKIEIEVDATNPRYSSYGSWSDPDVDLETEYKIVDFDDWDINVDGNIETYTDDEGVLCKAIPISASITCVARDSTLRYNKIELDPFDEYICDDMSIQEFIKVTEDKLDRQIESEVLDLEGSIDWDDLDAREADRAYDAWWDRTHMNEELIKPKKDEKKDDFIGRFMSDDLSKKEFPNNKQRFAVCMSIWGKSQKD